MKLHRKVGEPFWFTNDPSIYRPGVVCEVSKEEAEQMGLQEESAMSLEDAMDSVYDPMEAGSTWHGVHYRDSKEQVTIDDSFQNLLGLPKRGFCLDILWMYLRDDKLDFWSELPGLRDALWDFRNRIEQQITATDRGVSPLNLEKMVRTKLCPALDISALGNIGLVFGSLSSQDFVQAFDRVYWELLDKFGQSHWLTAVDTVRHILRLWPRKLRVSDGETLVLRHTRLKLHLREWPFCELCWNLSDDSRFCNKHRPGTNEHKALSKKSRKARFEAVCNAFRNEVKIDEKLKADLEQLPFASTIGVNSLERAIRFLSFDIASRKQDQLSMLVKLAEHDKFHMQTFGRHSTDQWLAEQCGVSKQSVNKLRKLVRGRIDLHRTNALIQWWPSFSEKTQLNP